MISSLEHISEELYASIDSIVKNNLEKVGLVLNEEKKQYINFDESHSLSLIHIFAFITMGGITPLLQTLRELEQRSIPGKILTTDYLTFSDPKALRILANFKNIELKMFVTENAKEGFHTKGYIFKKEEMYRIIVGSSNMTLSALTTNREWNTKIVSTEQGDCLLYTSCSLINQLLHIQRKQKVHIIRSVCLSCQRR